MPTPPNETIELRAQQLDRTHFHSRIEKIQLGLLMRKPMERIDHFGMLRELSIHDSYGAWY
jgi:hypothetical protein